MRKGELEVMREIHSRRVLPLREAVCVEAMVAENGQH